VTRGEGATRWFRECFGADAEGVWYAPGRVNLIGEHTDYNDGWVLPFALGSGVVAAAARREDGVLAIRSRQEPGDGAELDVATLRPGSVQGWAAYPAGVAWALADAGYPVPGASLAIDSDLPQGAGLSSSAALECATALALTGLAGVDVPLPELASLTRRAENEMAGVPSGIMDQSASLLCRQGHALLLDCRTRQTSAVPLDPVAAGMALLVVDTRARHSLADGRYSLRRQECEKAAQALGAGSLRDVAGAAELLRLADPVLRRRARHVVTENARVLAAVELLRAGDLAATGALLWASHDSLRDDFEVSWEQADVAVAAARDGGALGARMVGGGFGGSVIALVPGDGAGTRTAIGDAYAQRGWPAPQFLPAPPSSGARRLT
jgi:galactokinase